MIPGAPTLSHGSPAANAAMPEPALPTMHATTILMVRKGQRVVIGGDGQVSLGQTIVKGNAKKVRRLAKGAVIGGFAGATADAFTLFERLEAKLEQYPGQLTRACVELTKDWRTDRYLRRLEAMMLVADKEVGLLLSGAGDVIEPEGGRRGDRLRRQLCARRRAGARRWRPRRRGDRAPRPRHRGGDLRLHQRQRGGGEPRGMSAANGDYGFRPMTAADMPMARRWLETPEVQRWWGDADGQVSLLEEDLEDPRMSMWIVSHEGRPFAYIQDYDPRSWDMHHLGDLLPGSRGIDQFIGEPDMLGRGHGSALIRAHVERLFAAGAPAVGTDPDPENARAIRAYEKAGFIRLREAVDTEGQRVLLMLRRAPQGAL